MNTVEELDKRFGIEGTVTFEERAGGFVVVNVENAHATASIAMQGAHLLSYQPRGQEPMIWVSPEAKLAAGMSIRGGVPVCWPWFGPHANSAGFPAHGFARTVPWRLNQVHSSLNGETRLEFELVHGTETGKMWPETCAVRNIITVGKSLRHELVTSNHGAEAIEIGQALHTYFQVGDVTKARVLGLEGCDYLDKVNAMQRTSQKGPVTIASEVDRIYLDTPAKCEIVDASMGRRIVISSEGSHSTVVWNPWVEKAEQMGDLGEEGYLNMLCVKTANAATDTITIGPGAQHRLVAQYSIVTL